MQASGPETLKGNVKGVPVSKRFLTARAGGAFVLRCAQDDDTSIKVFHDQATVSVSLAVGAEWI